MIWTTKDGQKLQVSAMTDKHIRNCIAHLRKCLVEQREKYFSMLSSGHMLNGEAAQDLFESEVIERNRLYDEFVLSATKWIDVFEKELKNRSGQCGLDLSLLPERVSPYEVTIYNKHSE